MKYILLITITFLFSIKLHSQDSGVLTTNKIRINIVNPAIEIDRPTGNKSILTTGLGVGYGGSYPDLTLVADGWLYIISPFLDIQHKWFTNLEKRHKKGKSTESNSGNFISMRLLIRGESITENVIRTTNTDFAIGPTWGIQRNFANNWNLLFDVGPIYYFDTEGTGNFFPLIIQLNLGYNIK